MLSLLVGIIIFFGMHLVSSFSIFREKIILEVGKNRYRSIYSIISIVGISLIVYGKSTSSYLVMWEPPTWAKAVVFFVMLVSFSFFALAGMKSNIKRFIPYPILVGVLLWAGGHLFANGDLASIILFGSFAIYALSAILLASLQGTKKQEQQHSWKKDAMAIFAGIVVYFLFITVLHPYIIGVVIV